MKTVNMAGIMYSIIFCCAGSPCMWHQLLLHEGRRRR